VPIEGLPPDMMTATQGCPFAPRCPLAFDRCLVEEPLLRPAQATHPGHLAACHLDIADGQRFERPTHGANLTEGRL
jgi:oligopeptide/dipeptide ABC transporter ATP-binding protein